MTLLKPLVICGPSGAGKTTLSKNLIETYPDKFQFCISTTTRAMRRNEKHGRDYFFISKNEFIKVNH